MTSKKQRAPHPKGWGLQSPLFLGCSGKSDIARQCLRTKVRSLIFLTLILQIGVGVIKSKFTEHTLENFVEGQALALEHELEERALLPAEEP